MDDSLGNKLVCFKCEKEFDNIEKFEDCLPWIDGGFAQLSFGFGSKFDMGCTGYIDQYDHIYGGDLLEVLSSNAVYALICDECFQENYKKLLVYRKSSSVEFKRIQ